MISVTTVVLIGLLAAAAKIIFLAKIGAFRRVLAFDAVLDLVVGSVFGFLFYGTLTGMVIAAIATLFFSAFCYCWKQFFGYERFTLTGYQSVPARWRRPEWKPIAIVVVIAGLCAIAVVR